MDRVHAINMRGISTFTGITPRMLIKSLLIIGTAQVVVLCGLWNVVTLTDNGRILPFPRDSAYLVNNSNSNSNSNTATVDDSHDMVHRIWSTWDAVLPGEGKILNQACRLRTVDDAPIIHEQVTLAVHAGASKLTRLFFSIQRWGSGGLVSASIYISSRDDVAQLIEWCQLHANELQSTDIHLFLEHLAEPATAGDSSFKNSRKTEYPHNILRQNALSQVGTDYFLALDVDFVTPPNASTSLNQWIQSDTKVRDRLRTGQYLMVLPALEGHVEIADDALLLTSPELVAFALPRVKEDVLSFIQSKHVSPFHMDMAPLGHGATNFPKWLSYSSTSASFYPIDYALKYEPYVLGYRRNNDNDNNTIVLPAYWEGFRGWGFNKWTWLAEAYFSGFQYGVGTCSACFVTHVHHPRRPKAQQIPDYEEYRHWQRHFRASYHKTREETEYILEDRKEFQGFRETSNINTIDQGGVDLALDVDLGSIPHLLNWTEWDGRVWGRVFHSPLFRDREWIGTAPITEGSIAGNQTVTSASGQRYYLSERPLRWWDGEESSSSSSR